jgi:hypothetical protein
MTSTEVFIPSSNEVVAIESGDHISEFALDLITPNGAERRRPGELLVAAADVTEKTLDTLFEGHAVDQQQTETMRAQRVHRGIGSFISQYV